MIGGSCRPFKNVVVCATGVLDKVSPFSERRRRVQSDTSQPALFKLAIELGATSVRAFTDRVTHLVAENHGGAKYFVSELDVVVCCSAKTRRSARWNEKSLSCCHLGS
jgi:hypothetical protein